MSETQKLFASISGTFAVHAVLILLLLPPLLIQSARWKPEPSAPLREREEPMEVVVDLAELLDEVEEEPVEPELPMEEGPRPFVNTDSNTPEAEAPETAAYESDRNTTAASRLQPDPNLPPDYKGPTVRGNLPVPDVVLEERDYTDGEAAGKASPGSGSNVARLLANTSVASPGRQQARAQAAAKAVEGENDKKQEGEKTENDSTEPKPLTRPTEQLGETIEKAMSVKSFTDPNGSRSIGREMGEEEKEETTDQIAEEIGETTDPPKEMVEKIEEVEEQKEEQINPADAGMFADGLSLEEKMSILNGESSRLGDNAVDAEDTPLGRYKKKVWEEVGKQWNRERIRHKDDFTVGVLWIEGVIHRDGSVTDLRMVESETTSFAVERSLHSINIADIPPMPPEVAKSYGGTGLVFDFRFIIY